jgi:putative transposase
VALLKELIKKIPVVGDLAGIFAGTLNGLSHFRIPRTTGKRAMPAAGTAGLDCTASSLKHLKSTNMLERLNEEIKRRTLVVRIFPNAQNCLRLIRALAVETHENWLGLREHKKLIMRPAA